MLFSLQTANEDSQKLQEEIDVRNKTILELKQKLVEAEKEKDADLMKLRLEVHR